MLGSSLAAYFATAGHQVILAVRDLSNFKGRDLLDLDNIKAEISAEAVNEAEVVLIATPATAVESVAASLGNTEGKVIIDAMNSMGRIADHATSSDALLAYAGEMDLVKCFNTTGYNNMIDPVYEGIAIDMFMAGGSERAKEITRSLALDAGFAECYDIGANDKFALMEQFAFFWINLAMFQGQGREIAFRLVKR